MVGTKDDQKEIYLDKQMERDLLNRLSRIEGHLRAIKRMLEEHQSCNDILVQMAAVKLELDVLTYIGGTCVNVGCVPSKFSLQGVNHYHHSKAGRHGGHRLGTSHFCHGGDVFKYLGGIAQLLWRQPDSAEGGMSASQ